MNKKAISLSICLILLSFVLTIGPINATEKKCGFAFFSPMIDGVYDFYSWNDSLSISYDFGKVLMKNNKDSLFVFIDFVMDLGNDTSTFQPRCDDYFEFIVDWDGNKKISPGLDRIYTLCKNETKRLIYRYYLGKGAFSEVYFSQGQGISGFGATPNHGNAHRIYEFTIPLSEAKKEDLKEIYFGIKVVSKTPNLYYEYPHNLYQDLSGVTIASISQIPKITLLNYSIGSRNMTANGSLYQMDTEPMLISRRSFLPIRYVIEPIGGIFQWNSNDQRLVVMIKDLIIEMKVNDPYAFVNGKKTIIEKFNHSITPRLIPPGRVFVPLRFIGETTGGSLTWNPKLQTISIQYKVT
jgi:hypothetical protein